MTSNQQRNGQAIVDAWNKTHGIGDPVEVLMDDGRLILTATRSKAHVMATGVPVIWLKGITGCYLLERVRAAKGGEK